MGKRVWSTKHQQVVDADTGLPVEPTESADIRAIEPKPNKGVTTMNEQIKSSTNAEATPKDLSVATVVGTKVLTFLQEAEKEWTPMKEVASAVGEDFFKVIGSLSELTKMGLVEKAKVNSDLCAKLTEAGKAYDTTQEPRKPHKRNKKAKSAEGGKPTVYMIDGFAFEVEREGGHTFLAVNGSRLGSYAISLWKVFKAEPMANVEITIKHQEHIEVFKTILTCGLFDYPDYNPEDFVDHAVVLLQ